MHIGICLFNNSTGYRGGTNSFIHGLLGGLQQLDDTENHYYLIVYENDKKYYSQYIGGAISFSVIPNEHPLIKRIKDKILRYFVLPGLRHFYLLAEAVLRHGLIKKLRGFKYDVYYYPVIQSPIQLWGTSVVSPHDIQPAHYPQNFPFVTRCQRDVLYINAMRRATITQASTHFIGNDFHKTYNIPNEKIKVIPEGVMDEFINFVPDPKVSDTFLQTHQIEPGYIFYPSQHWPHKNHQTLLKAMRYVKEKYGVKLRAVFTGEKQPHTFAALYAFIHDNGFDSVVSFLGNIKFEELFYAYTNALAVAIPVVYESSSLPIKEAMALGKPVLASANGANEEINLDDNILLFSTYSEAELGEQLYRVYSDADARAGLVERSKKVIRNFRWENIARQYVQLFKELSR